jgi:pSer/pThr/pTyr-binding forkhead associated (FHA) protein
MGGSAAVATIAVTMVLFCAVSGALGGLVGALFFNLIARLTGGIEVSAEAVAPATELPPAASSPLLPAAVLPPAPAAETIPFEASGSAWLEVSGSPLRRWALRPGVVSLGSAPGNDIVINDLQSRHAELRYEDLRYYAIPIEGSVQVNDVDVTARHSLRDNARLRLGPVELIFHLSRA